MGPGASRELAYTQKKKPDRHSLGKTQKPKERPAGPPAGSELPDKICYKLCGASPAVCLHLNNAADGILVSDFCPFLRRIQVTPLPPVWGDFLRSLT
jgi:hypothetical protein